MANEPPDKPTPSVPPASARKPEEQPTASQAATPGPTEQDLPPDFDWQLRAHPVVPPKTPVAPPVKKEAPAAAGSEHAATAPPKTPVSPARPAARETPPAPTVSAGGEQGSGVREAAQGAPSEKLAAPVSAPPKPATEPPRPPVAVSAPKATEPQAPTVGAAVNPPAAAPATAPPSAKPAAPPPPPKEVPPKPAPLENELVRRYKARFGDAIREAWLDRKQQILVVDCQRLGEVAKYSREEEAFDFLADLTVVDWPKREKRFDVVLQLYSFPKNERLRIKAMAAAEESVPTVSSIWSSANWLEREAFDMFGVRFEGHPNLERILLPAEWQGHPLRKDYDILTQDTAWVRENLGIPSGQ